MTHTLKKSLLLAAMVTVLTAGQVGMTNAQDVVLDLPTRAFIGTIDDAPAEVPGRASAYYDPATGDLSIVVGAQAILLGLNGEAIINENLIPLVDDAVLGALTPAQNDEGGIGYLDTNGIIRTLTGGFQQGVAGGPFNLGPLLQPGLTTPAAFDAALNAGGPAVFFTAGFAEGAGFPNIAEGFQILTPETAVVPEPGSLSLLALSALGFAARRRR